MNISQLLSKMTIEEKCAILGGKNTWETRDYPHLGIPSIWLSDGPNGLRKQLGAADHLGLAKSEPATCFPTAATAANSWDTQLGEEIGRALAQEAAAQRLHVLLGPGLNIKRSPLCGRNFEYFSEDPYLAGKMAAAYIRGIQDDGGSACPKHFAVNSQEERRMASNSVVDERTLREIYLTAFEIAVKEGRPKSIMTSYNGVNGEYANENRHLLMDILRKEWGFDGVVVTDWGGSNDHVKGVQNGSTLEMPCAGLCSVRELLDAVKKGTLSQQDIDDRVAELLRLISEVTPKIENAPKEFDISTHHRLARRAAAESVVLLKNEDRILPLAGQTVAVIGDMAFTLRYQGAGSSVVNPTQVEEVIPELERSGVQIVAQAQGYRRDGSEDEALAQQAVEAAKQAEIVLYYMGLDEISESEGLDRRHMGLHQNQIDLLAALTQANPNVVVIMVGGSAVEMPFADLPKAIVHGYLGGQAAAGGMADVLTGRVNPSGKLNETIPMAEADTPTYGRSPSHGWNSLYKEGIYVGYRYYDKADVPVRYPFGFGLSYTTFAYSNLSAAEGEVTFTLTNTGPVAGAEVAQVYVEKKDSRIFRAVRELKGFRKVFLNPGESKAVTIPLDDKAFRYYNVATGKWEIEGGEYLINVGASSRDIRLQGVVTLAGTEAPDPYEGRHLPSYESGLVQNVPDEEFASLLGFPIPEEPKKIHRNSAFRDMNHSRSLIGQAVYGVLSGIEKQSYASGKPSLNVEFIYNMPLRGLSKFAGGLVDGNMVDGLVMEMRGWWIVGLIRFILGFFRNLILNAGLSVKLKKQSGRECG